MTRWLMGVLLVLGPGVAAAQEVEGGAETPAVAEQPAPPPESPPRKDRPPLDEQIRSDEGPRWSAPAEASRDPKQLGLREHRIFGVGTAGGGGIVGLVPISSGYGYGYGYGTSASISAVTGTLPTIELRAFLTSGLSFDFSLPLGDLIRNWATGVPAFMSDIFINFNPVIAPGIRMVLGPGVGGGVGALTVSNPYGGYGGGSVVGSGMLRLDAETGVEFLAAQNLVSVSLTARPFLGFVFSSASYYYYSGSTAQPWFTGGIQGLVSVSLNVNRPD